jgi:hypothetical protein
MGRPLRIEYEGALYHLIERGNQPKVQWRGLRLWWRNVRAGQS